MVGILIIITIISGVLLYLIGTGNNILNSIPFIGNSNPKITLTSNDSNTSQNQTQPQQPTGLKSTIQTEATKQFPIPAWIIILVLLIITFK